jgi:UDP-N-acetylmuramoyl-L-alanyl-D-glutamate--2,6-diaminopimelate ligase
MTWSDVRDVLGARGLVGAVDGSEAESGRRVTGIAYDSRKVHGGNVFVALRGQHADGSSYAQQAVERGAMAIVSELPPPAGFQTPWVAVSDARLALALLSAAFHRHPSSELRVIGITGTNGKTTTAFLIASIFDAARIRCSVLGTVGFRINGESRPATHTTPEAPDLQALLRESVDRGVARARWRCLRTPCRCDGLMASRSRRASSRT